MKKRLQNHVAESHYALMTTALYTLLIWYVGSVVSQWPYLSLDFSVFPWKELILFAVSTYLMMELNNSNALIRIYSRMVSCSFMVLSVMSLYVVKSLPISLVIVCFVTFLLALFNIYQDKRASAWTFYAFLCIGIASSIFPKIVFFVPFVWLFMAYLLMAFGSRTFWSSLIGLIAPYWFIAPYCLLTGNTDFFTNLYEQLIEFQTPFQYSEIGIRQILSFSLTALTALIGIVHFLRNSFRDKIRTRMFYNIFIYFDLLILLFIILQPQYFDVLLSMMIVVTSPLIGHFVALTNTRATNILFCVLLAVILLITLFNLLPPDGFELPSLKGIGEFFHSLLPAWLSSLIS